MMRQLHTFLGLVGTLALWVMALTACSEKQHEITVEPILLEENVEVIRDVVLLYSDSMHLRARVEGPLMVKYNDPTNTRDEFRNGVRLTFYDLYGEVSSVLTADFGVRYANTQEIRAIGNVVFESVAQERMDTEELIWDPERDMVYTRKFVMITTPKEKVWGMGFESNQDFTMQRIFAPEGSVTVAGLPED